MAVATKTDWAFGPGKSPAMGAFIAGFTTTTVTAGAYLSGSVHPWWGVAAGGLAAAGSILTLVVDNHLKYTEGPAMCYRAACWLGAGIWSTAQLSMHPWSWTSVGILAGMTAAAGTIGTALRHGEGKRQAAAEEKIRAQEEQKAAVKAAIAAAAEAALLTEEQKIAAHWLPRFRKICRLPALEIEGVEIWPTGDGYTLGGLIPDDGSTVEANVRPYEQSLATSADLRGGCNVAIRGNIDGESRRVFHALVNTHNAMADDQPYPADYGNRTIFDRVALGVAADRSIGTVTLLDNSMVLIGQTGSGKSTTLNVATAEVVRCTDALVFAIDTKGNGEYPRRWVTAWHEGRAERPAIHLVAVTDEQAELMCLGILNIVQGRPVAYGRDMLTRGERKIMPTPQLPQIILIVDEFKSLTDTVKAYIELIKDKGRSAAVEVIVCALEANASAIPRSLIKQCRERVGMRFSDEMELQHLFDSTWKSGRFDPSSMTHPGMMLLSSDAKPPLQHKAYDLPPAQIDEISIVVGAQRPPLDDASIAMFDTVTRRVRDEKGNPVEETVTGVYSSWWNKTKPLMFGTSQNGAAMANAGSVPSPQSKAVGNPLDALASSNTSLQRAMENLRAEAADAEAKRDDPEEPAPSVEELEALLDLTLPARQRYFALMRQAGPAGIGATAMEALLQEEGYPTVRQTIQNWMLDDAAYERALKLDGGRYAWNPNQP